MALPEYLNLRMRLRPDLVISHQQMGSRRSWIVKDPVALRYFTFGAEEYSILQSLDRDQCLDDLREQFEGAFAPQRMSTSQLVQFLSSLYASGLLLLDSDDQGAVLLEKNNKQLRQDRLHFWSNWLAIRFRGIDPESMLCWLHQRVRWCFSTPAAVGFALLVVAASILILTQFAEFKAELPTVAEFVSIQNLLWLSVALAIAKVFHELAHALVCKHFGGECHEIGVMLLLFTPCLYCNVTDAWMLQERWKRIAVSAAGIAAEVILASIAVFGWWLTPSGLLHTICVNLVLVCAVGTVFFNGNPLLRYDGYFILSDWLDLPNLWQESRALLRQLLYRWFTVDDDRSIPRRIDRSETLITYGICSLTYQVIVIVGVTFAVYRWLTLAGLDAIANLALVSVLCGFGSAWFQALKRHLADPQMMRRTRWLRVLATTAVLGGAIGTIFIVPFPCNVVAPALIQPKAARHLYVTTEGILKYSVAEGTQVKAGQEVARLENRELDRKVAELTGEYERLAARVKHMEVRATVDAVVAADLVVVREMCADAKKQLEQQQLEQLGLTLVSPVAGTVIPPPVTPAVHDQRSRLPTWSGTPLDSHNSECHLSRGTLFCLIGDPTKFEAVAFVDEADIQFVRRNQPVQAWFENGRAGVLRGTVEEIAEGDMQFVPAEVALERDLASRKDASGNRMPLETSYQVRLDLERQSREFLVIGLRGSAKIAVESQTLAERLMRLITNTLNTQIPIGPTNAE